MNIVVIRDRVKINFQDISFPGKGQTEATPQPKLKQFSKDQNQLS
jgi:hypothetical protein